MAITIMESENNIDLLRRYRRNARVINSVIIALEKVKKQEPEFFLATGGMGALNDYQVKYDEYVFISNNKTKIGKSTIKRRLGELSAKAGISKSVHPQLLRASNATHRILEGWNPWEVKEHMRHSKLSTTEFTVLPSWMIVPSFFKVMISITIFPPGKGSAFRRMSWSLEHTWRFSNIVLSIKHAI